MQRVFFINGQNQWVAEVFEKAAPPQGFSVDWCPLKATDSDKIPYLQAADFLVLHPAELPTDLQRSATNVKLIQLLTAGYDKIDLRLAGEMGTPVATNGGANSWAVAEHAVALLLSLYKRLTHCDRSVREGRWRQPITGFNTFEVARKTVGLIGAGNIGQKVARRLFAFECRVLYYDVIQVPEIEEELGAKRVSLEELYRQADIISLHVPSLPETRGLINRDTLNMMKPTAVLLNTSRGAAVVEEDLIQALKEKKIAGAGLDVFVKEPLPSDHPFSTLENVVLSPHSAGNSYEGWFRRSQFAWENIQRVSAGLPPFSIARLEE